MQKRLILAAGHGGGDSGATGQGTTEAATAIDIVNRTADLIRADGRFEVHVVPHELGLIDTINYINARFQDLEDGFCLEVHKNAAVGGHGIELWYYGGDQAGADHAAPFLDGLVRATGLLNRGLKGDDTNRWGRLGFIRDTNPWAGLAECGFITDGGDPLFPDKYAQGIYEGARDLFGLAPKAVEVPAPAPVKTGFRWRVTNLDGAQLGVYNEKANAWNKYQSVNGSARIFESAGRDVTGDFVAEFRPTPVPPPEPTQTPSEPTETPTPTPAPVTPPVTTPNPTAEVKPAWTSTEFYVTVFGNLLAAALLLGDVPLPANSPTWLEGTIKGIVAIASFLNNVYYSKNRKDLKLETIRSNSTQ